MAPAIDPERLYGLREVATLLGLRASAVRDWARDGTVPAVPDGGRLALRGAVVLELLRRARARPAPPRPEGDE